MEYIKKDMIIVAKQEIRLMYKAHAIVKCVNVLCCCCYLGIYFSPTR